MIQIKTKKKIIKMHFFKGNLPKYNKNMFRQEKNLP